MTRQLLASLAAIAALACATVTIAQPADKDSAAARLVLRHATIVDGSGHPPQRAMAVVIRGERIEAVTADSALTPATLAGAQIIDLTGKYLMPGLIDTHVHLATPPNRREAEAILRRDLYGGVTTVRDMADDLRAVGELARQARVGEIAAPDIYYAALMAGPSFFDDPRTWAVSRGATPGKVPWMQAITDDTDMPLAVAMARGTSATAIKIYANLPAHLVAKITAEAHRQHVPVWAHSAVFPASPREVVDAGVDVVSHICYQAYQVSDAVPASYQARVPVALDRLAHGDNPVMADLFRDMVARGTLLDPTGRVYVADEARAAAHPSGKPLLCSTDLAARLTNQAWRAGVPISTGTDGVAAAGHAWPEVFDELDFLVHRAKLPTADVIKAATLTGARVLGMEADLGAVAPGKLANIAILAKNPLDDIANVRSIVMTVKRGRIFHRQDYRAVTTDEISEGQ